MCALGIIIHIMEPISYSESLVILQQMTGRLRGATETLAAREAVSRVLCGPVFAKRPNPDAAVAAMDGIAVNALTIPDALVRLRQDQWQFINTGEIMSGNFNAVIKIEEVHWEEKIPVLDKKPNMYQNVRRAGEDFEKGTLLLAAEQQIQPQDVSLLLAAGCDPVDVYKKPVVSFIPTGSELVSAYDPEQKGKILESNSAMMAGLVEKWGGHFRLMDPVPDDVDDLAQMIKICVNQSDVVVISAGTSRGTKDLTAEVIRFMGTIHFHGVHMTPGKPVILGEVSGIPVLGLPGYPASAYICSYLYLRLIVSALSRVRSVLPRAVFISSEDIPAKPQDSFYRVNCFDVEGQTFIRRIEGGAGSIGSLSRMDGLMHVPPQTPIKKRDGVRIDVVHERAQNTITVRGVSDPGLSYLFGLLGRNLSTQRLLFWSSSGEDALQSIVERNLHVAIVGIPAQGQDPFESFSRQLQEPMNRYRAFTRTLSLVFQEGAHQELSRGMKIALPESQLTLWNSFVDQQGLSPDHFQTITLAINEKNMLDAFQSSRWDALLTDLRFLKDGTSPTVFGSGTSRHRDSR